MKEPVIMGAEALEVRKYLMQEFGDCFECCGVFMPLPHQSMFIEVIEPLKSCFLISHGWGTKNLVDGCIPVGKYRIAFSTKFGTSQHFIDLVPVDGSLRITACAGYADHSMIDWRGAKKTDAPIPTKPDAAAA